MCNLKIDGVDLEYVKEFVYLESVLIERNGISKEIVVRIDKGSISATVLDDLPRNKFLTKMLNTIMYYTSSSNIPM